MEITKKNWRMEGEVVSVRCKFVPSCALELVYKELNHLAAIVHVDAHGSYKLTSMHEKFGRSEITKKNWRMKGEVVSVRCKFVPSCALELVSKELTHLAAILHVYAGGWNFMK